MSSITETSEPEDHVTTQAMVETTLDRPVEVDRIEEEAEEVVHHSQTPQETTLLDLLEEMSKVANETELEVMDPYPREARTDVKTRREMPDLQEETTSLREVRTTAPRLEEPKMLAT
jgi:hypothetical protein